jgi:FAD/FMN-containing dehydrogenase
MLIEGWAMLARSMGYVYRPSTIDGIRDVFGLARTSGHSIVPRGSGFSYGDTSMNSENIVLDLRRLNRVLEWEPEKGIIRIEPGVSIGQLWRHVLEDGWWPRVVPGTMYPTLGGCSSTNVHGKNHWHAGSLGEQILAFDLLLPSGEIITCSRQQNEDIYYAAIGGLGMLGVFVSLTFRLEKVESGLLQIEERACASLQEMFELFEREMASAGHLLGWIDGYGRGSELGRGLVQIARPLENDREREETLRAEYQDLPETLFGVFPRALMWRGMKPMMNERGMRLLNATRYKMGARRSGVTTRVPHAQFHFILDYVPNWKYAFRPGGILQYQVFVPEETARQTYGSLLEEAQKHDLVPYLAVFKRHRRDPFLLNYSVDGYSLALDFHVTQARAARIEEMLRHFTKEIVLPAGGRFYPAKDNAVDRESLQQSMTSESVNGYLAIKRRLDPESLLQSDLFRRVFA